MSETLASVHRSRGPISAIIHGCARGADEMAGSWARKMRDRGERIREEPFPADWRAKGKAAGVIRNQRMIDEGRPDLVIAFPGGRGTADMIRRAKAAGLEVIEVSEGEAQ